MPETEREKLIQELYRTHIGMEAYLPIPQSASDNWGVYDSYGRLADYVLADRKRIVESHIKDVEGIPTGLFDSTPYKEKLIAELKEQVKNEN